ncbi:MAG: aminoglycoside 3'-phosphotransferase [Candidatus Heimdallarchaeota archaeon]|nr:aminoglycoside 3'-phosphotransferase [Candidatus Heimdallarchaeota archaeon]MCK4254633.1 aminoglycoside 3'-phosphotransferase [Candidatus Heimdallarchaeota archaeon]
MKIMKLQKSEVNLPEDLVEQLKSYHWQKVNIGWSRSEIHKLTQSNKPTLFLKINNYSGDQFFNKEYEMLKWLKDKISVPEVIYQSNNSDYEFLLLTEIPGKVSYEVFSKSDIETNLKILAKGLQIFHALPMVGCPNEIDVDKMIQHAKKRLEQGLVNNKNFDIRWKHKTPDELFEDVKRLKPKVIDKAVTHGDYCLPNVLINNKELSGFVDLGSAGINDRYYDLAAVSWSIFYNFGQKWVPYFFEKYGINYDEIDRERMLFYQMLNEFIEF